MVLFLASIALGSVWLPPHRIISVLLHTNGGDETARTIVWSVRLPRTFTAIVAGAALSVAGLLMQTLFRNPLADSSILGVSAGASLGVAIVVLGTSSSIAVIGRYSGATAIHVTVASAIGSSVVLALVLAITQRVESQVTVLVAGLMVATIVGAGVSLLLYFSSLDAARNFATWSLGSFRGTTWDEVVLLTIATALGLVIAVALAKNLDGLLLGDRYAVSLGMNLRVVRTLRSWQRRCVLGPPLRSAGRSDSSASPCPIWPVACCVRVDIGCSCSAQRCWEHAWRCSVKSSRSGPVTIAFSPSTPSLRCSADRWC